MLDGPVGVSLAPLDHRQLSIQEGTVRRQLDGTLVRRPRLIQPVACRRRPRRLNHLLYRPETQYLDTPADVDEGRIRRQRGLERLDRVDVAFHRQERLPAA